MLVEAKEGECGVCFNRAVYALQSGLSDLGLGLVCKRVNLRYFLRKSRRTLMVPAVSRPKFTAYLRKAKSEKRTR